jgi:hypothetical protein
MWRKSSNNGWIPPQGLNSAAVVKIGGDQVGPTQRFQGQLGNVIVLNNADALKVSNINGVGGGTLYMGAYQLVRFASAVTTVTKGQLLFWDTLALNGQATYTVTATSTAATAFRAGVALFAETAGGSKYAYIQIGGLASISFGAGSGTVGLGVIQASAVNVADFTATTVNTITDATAGTAGINKAWVGQVYETTVTASALNRVWIAQNGFLPNVTS